MLFLSWWAWKFWGRVLPGEVRFPSRNVIVPDSHMVPGGLTGSLGAAGICQGFLPQGYSFLLPYTGLQKWVTKSSFLGVWELSSTFSKEGESIDDIWNSSA